MKSANEFYIYALYDPEIGVKCLFYIGQTKKIFKSTFKQTLLLRKKL